MIRLDNYSESTAYLILEPLVLDLYIQYKKEEFIVRLNLQLANRNHYSGASVFIFVIKIYVFIIGMMTVTINR